MTTTPEQILIANVRAMRFLQKEYFKTRSSDVLARCKQAEREVDRALQALSERQETINYDETRLERLNELRRDHTRYFSQEGLQELQELKFKNMGDPHKEVQP